MRPIVEVAQQLGGVEAVGRVVDRPARLEPGMERRSAVVVGRCRAAHGPVPHVHAGVSLAGGYRCSGAVQGTELRERAGAKQRCEAGQHPASAQAMHNSRLRHV